MKKQRPDLPVLKSNIMPTKQVSRIVWLTAKTQPTINSMKCKKRNAQLMLHKKKREIA